MACFAGQRNASLLDSLYILRCARELRVILSLSVICEAWVTLTAFFLWWFVIRGFPWYRLLNHH